MTLHEGIDALPEPRRREIFLALVELQDHATPVPLSRQVIAQRFGIAEDVVQEIECEGMDNDWPPLDGDDSPPE